MADSHIANMKLIPWQYDFVDIEGDHIYLLAHGGRGSGKSRAGAYKTLRYVYRYPGAVGIITAPTFDMVRSATLPSIISVWEEAGFKYGKHFEYNQSTKEFRVDNGTTLLFRSTEEPEHLRGFNGAFWWMDEATQSPFAAYTNLSLSLRQPGFPHMGWATTTPTTPMHWLFELFFGDERDEQERTGRKFFTFAAPTYDNPYGGKELFDAMVDQLGGIDSPLVRRELLGEFTTLEGLVYPDFSTTYHIKDKKLWPVKAPRYVVAGIDFGWSAPSAIVVEGYTPLNETTGYRVLMDEFYKPKLIEEDLIAIAHLYQDKYKIRWFVADSEDQRFIAALRRSGLSVISAKKTRNTMVYRKALCTSVLNSKIHDEQAFFVDPRMRHYAKEMLNYSEKPSKEGINPDEKPRNYQNHAINAWEYVEMEIARQFTRRSKIRKVKGIIG